MSDPLPQGVDWSLCTWEGARREQQRRWMQRSLAERIQVLEDMQVLATHLARCAVQAGSRARPAGGGAEPLPPADATQPLP